MIWVGLWLTLVPLAATAAVDLTAAVTAQAALARALRDAALAAAETAPDDVAAVVQEAFAASLPPSTPVPEASLTVRAVRPLALTATAVVSLPIPIGRVDAVTVSAVFPAP
jgi:Flp pilus assembly protein TadG